MARYIICPRCELNFIDADEQEYCEVCLKELSGERTFTDDFEAEESIEETELCPICGENYMVLGEKMCEECKKKSTYEEEVIEDDEEEDASWRSYLDDEEEDVDLGIPDSEFEEELEEEELLELELELLEEELLELELELLEEELLPESILLLFWTLLGAEGSTTSSPSMVT